MGDGWWDERCGGGRVQVGLTIDGNPHTAAEAYPRHQPKDCPGMREEGDRIEGDAPGLPGAVPARCLHPSGLVLPESPQRKREETAREQRAAAASSSSPPCEVTARQRSAAAHGLLSVLTGGVNHPPPPPIYLFIFFQLDSNLGDNLGDFG